MNHGGMEGCDPRWGTGDGAADWTEWFIPADNPRGLVSLSGHGAEALVISYDVCRDGWRVVRLEDMPKVKAANVAAIRWALDPFEWDNQ